MVVFKIMISQKQGIGFFQIRELALPPIKIM